MSGKKSLPANGKPFKAATIAEDKAAIAFLQYINSKDPALGQHLAQQYAKNALLDRVARVVRAKPIKITLAKYRAADKVARSGKELAGILGASRQAVRKFELRRNISPTKKRGWRKTCRRRIFGA